VKRWPLPKMLRHLFWIESQFGESTFDGKKGKDTFSVPSFPEMPSQLPKSEIGLRRMMKNIQSFTGGRSGVSKQKYQFK